MASAVRVDEPNNARMPVFLCDGAAVVNPPRYTQTAQRGRMAEKFKQLSPLALSAFSAPPHHLSAGR